VAVKTNGSEVATGLRFERIHQVRAHEYVAEQIRRHIALRLIKPGEALPAERELAGMFGVGRPTIQHALRLGSRGCAVQVGYWQTIHSPRQQRKVVARVREVGRRAIGRCLIH